jgi:ABC-type uncharacterized transport system involved in gliding motility auxiliary subunit
MITGTTETPKKEEAPSSSNIKPERIRVGSNVVISLIGALVIIVAVNYLAMRHYKRADWTDSGLYTLSDKSIKVLESLGKDTMLFALWSSGDPSGRFEEVKEIMDRYAAVSPRLKVEMLDPDLKPERVKMIISQYGARLQQDESGRAGVEAGVFVVSGDNVKFVSSSDFEDTGDMMSQMDGETPPEGVSGFKAEQSLTSAILHVTSDEQPKICFTQGHGEWGFEQGGEGPDLSQLKQALVQDGMKTEAFATFGSSHIPKGCDVISVVGPQKAFMPEETGLLERFVEQGGKLLLFVDPIIEGTTYKDTGLESLTSKFGIKMNRDIVFEVDAARLVGDSPLTFIASEFSSNAAVKHLSLPDSVGADIKAKLSAFPVAFSTVRSLSAVPNASQIVETLASTSKDSWGETDAASLSTTDAAPTKDQYDTQGPVTIAMISALPTASADQKGGELIVVGDSDVLLPELYVNTGLSNRDFFSGLMGKLTKRPELISIAPKNPEHVRLNLSEGDLSTVTKLIWGEVVFFILLGVAVWMRRRS